MHSEEEEGDFSCTKFMKSDEKWWCGPMNERVSKRECKRDCP